jgi:hypothetical protein
MHYFRKSFLEFEVSDVGEIKVLLQSWYQVLARLQLGNSISQRLTENHLVNIRMDDMIGAEEVVVVQFLAPPDVLDGFIDELKAWGLAYSSRTLIPGLVTRCRLEKKLA